VGREGGTTCGAGEEGTGEGRPGADARACVDGAGLSSVRESAAEEREEGRRRRKEKENGKRKKKKKRRERKRERGGASAGDIRGGDRGAGRPRALRRSVGRRCTRSEEKKGDGTVIEIGCRDRDPMGNVSVELGLRGLGMIELNDEKSFENYF